MSDKDWERRAERFDKHPARTALIWLGGLIAICLVISAVLWALGVFASPLKGQGDAYREKHSAQNWVSAQAGFQRDYNSFVTFQQQIVYTKKQLTDFQQAHPNVGNGTPFDPLAEQLDNLQRSVTGLTLQCQNTATNYNTAAGSYLSQDFRDASLPEQLDPVQCTNPSGTIPTLVPTTH